MSRVRDSLLALLVLQLAPACLVAPPPPEVRFFEPPQEDWEAVRQEAGPEARSLNLLRVSAGAALGRPMVWRLNEVELAFDEQGRWIMEPAALVEDALRSALFVYGPFRAADARGAARLEVRVTQLEGYLGEERAAHVTLLASLAPAEARETVVTRRFTAQAPLASESAGDLARSIGQALQAVSLEIRSWLSEELGG